MRAQALLKHITTNTVSISPVTVCSVSKLKRRSTPTPPQIPTESIVLPFDMHLYVFSYYVEMYLEVLFSLALMSNALLHFIFSFNGVVNERTNERTSKQTNGELQFYSAVQTAIREIKKEKVKAIIKRSACTEYTMYEMGELFRLPW